VTSLNRWPVLTLAVLALASGCPRPEPSSAPAAAQRTHGDGDGDGDPADALAHATPAIDASDARCRTIPGAQHLADWPAIQGAIRQDAAQEAWIRRVVDAMTIEQKVGQMTQAEIRSLWRRDTRTYRLNEITEVGLGSVLGGGGTAPEGNPHATLKDWTDLADRVWEAGPTIAVRDGGRTTRVHIPPIWGEDMVHHLHPVYGSVLFPHNIGLGATRDICLANQLGAATSRGTRAVGIDWTFSPCTAVARDDRWGRTYESFSEDPSVVGALSAAMTEGLQGTRGDRTSFRGTVATAKHYIADGGSQQGIDQGVVVASEAELLNIHGPGYFGALGAGAQTVMVGFFGSPDSHGPGDGKFISNRHLITEVLKQKIGFDGFVVSDWNAIGFLPGCHNDDCPQAVNAGIDMFMIPFDWHAFIANTSAEVRAGVIPMSRIDDAVTRILRVKLRAGILGPDARDALRPSQRPGAGDARAIAPRELAARAVHESLVLLKNNGNVLPLGRQQKVLVVGKSADSIQNQTGGWSRNWQGGPHPDDPEGNPNAEFPGAQSILAGIQGAVGASRVTYSVDAANVNVRDFDVVIAAIGEFPYAEFFGDIATSRGNWRHPDDLSVRTLEHGHRYPEDRAVLEAVSGKGVPVVTLLVSGRVLYTNAEINLSDAFVAVWLPGTEGAAVSDVLFRRPDGTANVNFTGRLSFSWPRSACQQANIGDAGYHPQFPFGYGLSYPTQFRVGTLDQTPGPAGGCTN